MSRGLVAHKPVKKQKIVLMLRNTHFIKGNELGTEFVQLVGMRWRRNLDDEFEAIKFHRPRQQMWSPVRTKLQCMLRIKGLFVGTEKGGKTDFQGIGLVWFSWLFLIFQRNNLKHYLWPHLFILSDPLSIGQTSKFCAIF